MIIQTTIVPHELKYIQPNLKRHTYPITLHEGLKGQFQHAVPEVLDGCKAELVLFGVGQGLMLCHHGAFIVSLGVYRAHLKVA